MTCYIISWIGSTDKLWESERYTNTAKEAITSFKKDAKRLRKIDPQVHIVGIRQLGSTLNLRLVA